MATWQKILLVFAIACIAVSPFADDWQRSAEARYNAAMKLKQQAELEDLALITVQDPSRWNQALIGKPDIYLDRLGIVRYEKIPENVPVTIAGVSKMVQFRDTAGNTFIWMVVVDRMEIRWMSPALQEVPLK